MDDDLELDFDRFIYESQTTPGGDTFYRRVGCRHRNTEYVRDTRFCTDCNTNV